jgi:predicted SAM-dependent methyltransferase
MKINLGCGFNKLSDFVNCDSNKRCKPDKVIDFSKGKLPFKDNEVDEVFANCFLEKLGDNFYDIMKEIYRFIVCENVKIFT